MVPVNIYKKKYLINILIINSKEIEYITKIRTYLTKNDENWDQKNILTICLLSTRNQAFVLIMLVNLYLMLFMSVAYQLAFLLNI